MLTDHELSAMVAEKVYGDKRTGEFHHETGAEFWIDSRTGMEYEGCIYYATDQGLALDAALKDAEEGQPCLDLDREWGGLWKARIWRHGEIVCAEGSTPARALCFVKLRASGVTVEDDGEEG